MSKIISIPRFIINRYSPPTNYIKERIKCTWPQSTHNPSLKRGHEPALMLHFMGRPEIPVCWITYTEECPFILVLLCNALSCFLCTFRRTYLTLIPSTKLLLNCCRHNAQKKLKVLIAHSFFIFSAAIFACSFFLFVARFESYALGAKSKEARPKNGTSKNS